MSNILCFSRRCQLFRRGREATEATADQLVKLVSGDAERGHQGVAAGVQEHHGAGERQPQDEQHHAEHRQLAAATSVPCQDHFHQAGHPDHQHHHAEGEGEVKACSNAPSPRRCAQMNKISHICPGDHRDHLGQLQLCAQHPLQVSQQCHRV